MPVSYRYSAASERKPAHLECWVGEQSLDYNDGSQDVAEPDQPGGTSMWTRVNYLQAPQ